MVLLYWAAYALVSSSSFFASGYIFGIAAAFAATYVLPHLTRTPDIVIPAMRRLAYVTASSAVLVFMFIFYLYPPAVELFWNLRSTSIGCRCSCSTSSRRATTNPYGYLQSSWLSLPVYVGLTSFNLDLSGAVFRCLALPGLVAVGSP